MTLYEFEYSETITYLANRLRCAEVARKDKAKDNKVLAEQINKLEEKCKDQIEINNNLHELITYMADKMGISNDLSRVRNEFDAKLVHNDSKIRRLESEISDLNTMYMDEMSTGSAHKDLMRRTGGKQ